jgi:AcrR family transcriptional regulator
MLYHFATREELVEAAIAHIELHRARLLEQAASARRPAWTPRARHRPLRSLLHEPPFVAFAELEGPRAPTPCWPALGGARRPSTTRQLAATASAGGPGRRRPALPDQPRPGTLLLEGLAKGS